MMTDIVSDMVEEPWYILQSWQASKKANKKKLHSSTGPQSSFSSFLHNIKDKCLIDTIKLL